MKLTTGPPDPGRRGRHSRAWWAVLALAGLLVIFELDRRTGSAPFQHLYYLPIVLAGVTLEMPGGVLAAAMAILLYHLANPHLWTLRYEESDIVQIVLFMAAGLITAKQTRDRNRLRTLASTDDLTGLLNLRAFEVRLAELVRAAEAHRSCLAMLVVDLDRLKLLNDEHGHLTGAEAVRAVGHIIGKRLPAGAIACRYGGDEFAAAIPGGTPGLAMQVADDLRRAIGEAAPTLAGRAFPAGTLSVSVGVSSGLLERGVAGDVGQVDVGEVLFRQADAALYRAKAAGRNRVRLAEPEPVADPIGLDARQMPGRPG